MGIRWIFWLAFCELSGRPARTLLSVLALVLSVGLVAATGSIGALMRHGVASPAPQLGQQADLWISSAYDADYDLPASVARQVRSVQGVGSMLPLLRRPLRVESPPSASAAQAEGGGPEAGGSRVDSLTLVGADLEAYFGRHDLRLAAGRLPTAQEPGLVALAPWAVGRELVPGQAVTLTVPSGRASLPIAGLLEVESLASLQQGLVLYAPLEAVSDLFDLGDGATLLEVWLQPGAATGRVQRALEQALGPAYSVSATVRPRFQLWQRLVLGVLGFVDGLTLLASTILVYTIFSLAARARRRHIALLRVTGAGQRDVLVLLLAEALLLGIAGSLLGLVLGFGLACVGAAFVLEGSSTGAPPPMPAATLLLAATAGMAAAVGGALLPSIQAARQPPMEALRAVPPLTTLGHGLSRGWWPFALLSRLLRGRAVLVLANLSRQPGRALGIVAALALVLGTFVADVGVLSFLGEEMAASFGRLAGGDYIVLPALSTISFRELAGQDTSDVPPLSPGLLAALEGLAGEAWLMRGTTADVPALAVFAGQPTLLLDIEGYAQMGGFRFRQGNWAQAREAFRQGPAVLLAPVVARRLGVGLGDSLALTTPGGRVGFVVAGIGDSEFTTCILDLSDGVAYLGANEVNAVMVQVRPGVDGSRVRQALVEAVRVHGGTLLPMSRASAQLEQIFRRARLGTSLLIGASGLVALLGVINAMLSSTVERRREIGLLRAVGATQRQVTSLLLAEAALLGLAAAMLGVALGWACTLLFTALAGPVLGFASASVAGAGAWHPLLGASVAGLLCWPLLAMFGAVLPALAAVRMPIIQALGDGEAGVLS
jgi:putative ABC transport system permease protein